MRGPNYVIVNVKACNSCGKCCIKYGNGRLSASAQDLATWEALRPDIYRYVRNGNIWVNPTSGEQLELCPWLRREPDQLQFTCAIYADRPEDCRLYPSTISEMRLDECEMLEANDLKDTQHAQKNLDVIFKG